MHLINKVKVTVKVIGTTSILSLLSFPRSEDGSNLVYFKLHQQIVIDLSFVSDWSKEGRKFTIVRSGSGGKMQCDPGNVRHQLKSALLTWA